MPQALDRGSGPLEGAAPPAPSPETRPASVPGKAAQKRGPPGARRRSQTVPCPADDLWPDVSAEAGPSKGRLETADLRVQRATCGRMSARERGPPERVTALQAAPRADRRAYRGSSRALPAP